jgi:hypothetical protein
MVQVSLPSVGPRVQWEESSSQFYEYCQVFESTIFASSPNSDVRMVAALASRILGRESEVSHPSLA